MDDLGVVVASEPDADAIEGLPGELGEQEAMGLRHEHQRREAEARRQERRETQQRHFALDNWRALRECFAGDLPASLFPFTPLEMPDAFTGDCERWDVELPLPGGRPPLVARYRRSIVGNWSRELFVADCPWRVGQWRYSDGELAMDLASGLLAADLPSALILARQEAHKRQQMEVQLAEQARDRATRFAPPPACAPQCSREERVLLDALREYLWSQTITVNAED